EGRPLLVAVADFQHILAEFVELHLVDGSVIALLAYKLNGRLRGELSLDGVDLVAGAQGDHGRQIGRQRHSRHDYGVELVAGIELIANALEAGGPLQAELISDFASFRTFRGEVKASERKAPRLVAARLFGAIHVGDVV